MGIPRGGRRAQIGLRSTGNSRGPSTLEYAEQNTRRVAVTDSDSVEGVVGGRGDWNTSVNTAAIHHGLIVTSPKTLESGLEKEVGETIVMCGFQRGERASTPGLGRASTRQYSPSQPQPLLNRAPCGHFPDIFPLEAPTAVGCIACSLPNTHKYSSDFSISQLTGKSRKQPGFHWGKFCRLTTLVSVPHLRTVQLV